MPARFQLSKHHVVAVVGIVTAVLLFLVVNSRVAINKVSTLRITWPGAKPLDPPLLDIPKT